MKNKVNIKIVLRVFLFAAAALGLFCILQLPVRAESLQPVPVITGSSSDGACSITINWEAADGAEGYVIYRMQDRAGAPSIDGVYAVEPGIYEEIARIEDPEAVSFTDTGVSDNVIYEYTVAAIHDGVSGSFSSQGIFAHTSNYSEPYDFRITELSSAGFTITGKIAGYIPSSLRAAVWSEKDGQSDLEWVFTEISENKFTLRVSTEHHFYETGLYEIHFYEGERCLTSVYVDVPGFGDVLELNDPTVLSSDSKSYTIAGTINSVYDVCIARMVSYPAEKGPDFALESKAELCDGCVYGTVNAADFGGVTGEYVTELTLIDYVGNQVRHTFTVMMEDTKADMTLMQIDVGHGDSALLTSKGEFLLIDCARSEMADRVVEVLKMYGAEHVSVLITHRHSDHTGGLFAIAENFTVDHLYIDEDYAGETFNDEIHTEKAVEYYRSLDIPISTVEKGDILEVGDAVMTVIGPEKDYNFSFSGITNNNSKWLKISDGYKSFLTYGDAEIPAEEDMLSAETDLSCCFAKVPHHGIPTGSLQAVIDRTGTAYAVMSTIGLTYDQPPVQALAECWGASGAAVLSTSEAGSVAARDAGGNLKIYAKDETHMHSVCFTFVNGIDYACVFDASYYASVNPDVVAVFGEDPAALFSHFISFGMAEGRRGSEEFDLSYFIEKNPLLKEKFGSDLIRYYQYYISVGRDSGMQGSED